MTAARAITCPSCGGAIEVRAAGYSVTVACRYCGALLDVANPDVKLIADYHEAFKDMPLPLGARGVLLDVEWEVIGCLKRSDLEASWDELLLFNPYGGYRWLVRSDDGWQFGIMLADEPVEGGHGEAVEWRGDRFSRDYDPQETTTDKVVGEFYWRVEAGDQVSACTYSRGDETLSLETSRDEINWTLLLPMSDREVRDAFAHDEPHDAAPQGGKAPGQFGRKGAQAFTSARPADDEDEDGPRYYDDPEEKEPTDDLPMMIFMAIAAAILILAVMVGFGATTSSFRAVSTVTVENPEKTVTLGSITVTRPYQFVTIAATTSEFDNRWVDLDYSLVDRKTQRSIDAYGLAEHYSGRDSDGYWSEGSRTAKTLFSGVPQGTYDVTVDISAHRWSQYASSSYGYGSVPSPYSYHEEITLFFDVSTGGMSWGNYLIFVLLLFAAPALYFYFRYKS